MPNDAPRLRGVIFDMDGVLVDSEPFICRAAIAMLSERGVDAQPDDFLPFVGTGENSYLGGVARQYGLELDIAPAKARLYEIYYEIIKDGLRALPGAVEFVKECRQRGFKTAIATSADREKMDANLEAIGLDPALFDASTTGSEIEHKKPAPDIFLAAARKLSLSSEQCLVVEDAPSGVAAAKASGARCLALMTSFDRGALDGADWYAPHLGDASIDALGW